MGNNSSLNGKNDKTEYLQEKDYYMYKNKNNKFKTQIQCLQTFLKEYGENLHGRSYRDKVWFFKIGVLKCFYMQGTMLSSFTILVSYLTHLSPC